MAESAKIRCAAVLQVGLEKDVKPRHALTIAGTMARAMMLAHATVHQGTKAHLAIPAMLSMGSATKNLKSASVMQ